MIWLAAVPPAPGPSQDGTVAMQTCSPAARLAEGPARWRAAIWTTRGHLGRTRASKSTKAFPVKIQIEQDLDKPIASAGPAHAADRCSRSGRTATAVAVAAESTLRSKRASASGGVRAQESDPQETWLRVTQRLQISVTRRRRIFAFFWIVLLASVPGFHHVTEICVH